VSADDKSFRISTQGLHYVSRDTAEGVRMLVHLERRQDLRMLTVTELRVLQALLSAAADEVSRVIHTVSTTAAPPS
jgi:hypothetical protein